MNTMKKYKQKLRTKNNKNSQNIYYIQEFILKIKLFPGNNTKNLMTFYDKCTALSEVIMCL